MSFAKAGLFNTLPYSTSTVSLQQLVQANSSIYSDYETSFELQDSQTS